MLPEARFAALPDIFTPNELFRKDVIKSLFAIKQSEIPFDVIERDTKLPINRKKTQKTK